MARIFSRISLNRICLPIILASYTLSTLPLEANLNSKDVTFNDAVFLLRVEKLVEKLIKSKDKNKDVPTMIGYLVDIKNEIELSYNLKFDLKYYMSQVENELSAIGIKAPKKEFEYIKKLIKKKEKKTKNHIQYIADRMYLEDYEINAFEEENMFTAKSGKDKDDKEKEEEEIEIPPMLVYGVTMTLCGLFLAVLPIPACKEWGKKMIFGGISACATTICSRIEEDRKRDNDKKKELELAGSAKIVAGTS